MFSRTRRGRWRDRDEDRRGISHRSLVSASRCVCVGMRAFCVFYCNRTRADGGLTLTERPSIGPLRCHESPTWGSSNATSQLHARGVCEIKERPSLRTATKYPSQDSSLSGRVLVIIPGHTAGTLHLSVVEEYDAHPASRRESILHRYADISLRHSFLHQITDSRNIWQNLKSKYKLI